MNKNKIRVLIPPLISLLVSLATGIAMLNLYQPTKYLPFYLLGLTILLPSAINVTLFLLKIPTARKDKNSDNWYLGGITDEEQRTLTLSLDFLDEGNYRATIYRDGEKAAWDTYPTAYTIENISFTRDDELTITMARGGGFAIEICKE